MRDLPRTHLILYALAAVGIVVLGVRVLGQDGGGGATGGTGAGAASSAPRTGVAPAPVSVAPAPAASVVVHVAGAVRRPGVYRLPGGRRVQDAVRRAGGRAPGADLDAINLAARLVDGQQVVVPARAAATVSAGAAAGGAVAADGASVGPPAAPVGLNAATAEQLETLDGVGPATAEKIIAWRQAHGGFGSVDDLGQVPGIGAKRLAALRPHVQP